MGDRLHARKAGACPNCGQPIAKGEMIRGFKGTWKHEACWIKEREERRGRA